MRLEANGIIVDIQVLDGDWTLLAGTPRKPILHRHERIELGGAATAEAQPQVMSRALGAFADRIASALKGGAAVP